MSKVVLKNYLWLIQRLSKHPMTFGQLRNEYERSSLYEPGHPLQVRTLYNWRERIADIFDMKIEYDGTAYRIANASQLTETAPFRWLLQSLVVNDVVRRCRHLSPRILLESIPSGEKFLSPILQAMEQGRVINMVYRRFPEIHDREPQLIAPYCVKVNKRRWYVLCRLVDAPAPANTPKEFQRFGNLKIYALDRIQHMEITTREFVYPDDFDPQRFFSNFFGVYAGFDVPLQRVLLRVDAEYAKYFRTLGLHHSQREISEDSSGSVFEYHLHPTIDFVRAILSMGGSVEVLEPDNVRQQVASEAGRMCRIYGSEMLKKC